MCVLCCRSLLWDFFLSWINYIPYCAFFPMRYPRAVGDSRLAELKGSKTCIPARNYCLSLLVKPTQTIHASNIISKGIRTLFPKVKKHWLSLFMLECILTFKVMIVFAPVVIIVHSFFPLLSLDLLNICRENLFLSERFSRISKYLELHSPNIFSYIDGWQY